MGDQQATLAIDETGDPKKGTATVGVQHQYTRTVSRIENTQVGVDLVYASHAGHAIIDRELYLPVLDRRSQRCRAAGVPSEVGFATKSEPVSAPIPA